MALWQHTLMEDSRDENTLRVHAIEDYMLAILVPAKARTNIIGHAAGFLARVSQHSSSAVR